MQVDSPTLILDVAGAERGIGVVVRGAADAAQILRGAARIVLVTNELEETQRLVEQEFGPSPACELEIVHAPQKLPKTFNSPVDVYRSHPQSCIRMAMDIAKATPRSALISPTTTGLVMTAATFTLGRVKGIERPPIGTILPTKGRQVFFVDAGSVVDAKARHLYQFAVLAHLYVKSMSKIERPSIALLSNGSEEYKGNAVVKEAYEYLEADKDLNFTGYVEGHTMFEGDLDIMVCDGFLGNILLKFAEGASFVMTDILKQEIKSNWFTALATKVFLSAPLKRFRQRLDYAEVGGAPLLGLNGNVMICHGRSPAHAYKNALLGGRDVAEQDIAGQVAKYLVEHPEMLVDRNGNKKDEERRSASPGRRETDAGT